MVSSPCEGNLTCTQPVISESWSHRADKELFRLPDCTHWYTSCHVGELEPSGLQSHCQAPAVLQYLVPVAELLLIINNFIMAHYQSFWRARAAEPMSGSGCTKVQYLVPVEESTGDLCTVGL